MEGVKDSVSVGLGYSVIGREYDDLGGRASVGIIRMGLIRAKSTTLEDESKWASALWGDGSNTPGECVSAGSSEPEISEDGD